MRTTARLGNLSWARACKNAKSKGRGKKRASHNTQKLHIVRPIKTARNCPATAPIVELPTSPNDNAPNAESALKEEKEEEAELDRNRRPYV